MTQETKQQAKQRFVEIGIRHVPKPDDLQHRMRGFAKWEDHEPPPLAQKEGYSWGVKLPISRDAWAKGFVHNVIVQLRLPENTQFGWSERFEVIPETISA